MLKRYLITTQAGGHCCSERLLGLSCHRRSSCICSTRCLNESKLAGNRFYPPDAPQSGLSGRVRGHVGVPPFLSEVNAEPRPDKAGLTLPSKGSLDVKEREGGEI